MSKKPTDLIGYLLEKHSERMLEQRGSAAVSDRVLEFVETARAVLAENQPVSMDYLEAGFAVRLQDGTVLPFVDDKVNSTGGNDGSVELTKPDETKDKGIDRRGSYSFDITGGD